MKYSIIKSLKEFFKLGKKIYKDDFGSFGNNSYVPCNTIISNSKNIFLSDCVNIGDNSVLYATNAKIVIKKYFVSAIGLKISTGNHERRIGRFLASITEEEKNHNIGLDKDVIINEDVWAGFNVTILAGVEIGRGCTIAAGSVVTHSLPPYCISGGIPAKFIRFYWTIDEIITHELELYPKEERFSREDLEKYFKKYN